MQPLLCFGRAAVPHFEKSLERESTGKRVQKSEGSRKSKSPAPILVADCRGPEKLDWDACTPSPEPKMVKDPPVMVFDCTTTTNSPSFGTISTTTEVTLPDKPLTADQEIDRRIDEMTKIALVMKEKEEEDRIRRNRLEEAFKTLINQSKKMDGEMRAFFTGSSSPDEPPTDIRNITNRSPSPCPVPQQQSTSVISHQNENSKLQQAINDYVIIPPMKRVLRPTPSVEGIHGSSSVVVPNIVSESPGRSPTVRKRTSHQFVDCSPLSTVSAATSYVSRQKDSSSPGYRSSPSVTGSVKPVIRSISRASSLRRRDMKKISCSDRDDEIRFDPDIIEQTLRPTKWGKAVVEYPSRQSSPSCASPPRKAKNSIRRPLRDRSNSVSTTPCTDRLTVVGETVRASPLSGAKSPSILSWDPVESVRRNLSSIGGRTPQKSDCLDLPRSPSTRSRRNSVTSRDTTPTRSSKRVSRYRTDSFSGPGPAAYRPNSFNNSPSPRFSSSARF